MVLNSISLQNFRSFSKASFEFSKEATVIVGPNGAGKTNLLEAIYLLSTGKSFRSGIEEDMIRMGREIARVECRVENDESQIKLNVVLTRGQIGGERVSRKKLSVNGLPKRLVDFAGNLQVVLFGPWDMNLISDSPSVRRKFMDAVLSQTDREYHRASLSYEKGVRARNKLLERIRDEGASRGQLLFWNQLLVKNGDYISRKRAELVQFINSSDQLSDNHFQLEYDKSAISEARLDQYAAEEVAAAATLVGPHRDDVVFRITNHPFDKLRASQSPITKNLATFGSRGEQRMCILWVKLAELSFMESTMGARPLLLLDDIFSELDHEHREIVMGVIDNQQTILTTADPHTVTGLKKAARIEL
ncbi:DNA replication and repair protein RecF [Candidatus Microgenomates bacterium]|nr:DNA replication and repair protein RecF [Candidatus Microgenomates bacterium]